MCAHILKGALGCATDDCRMPLLFFSARLPSRRIESRRRLGATRTRLEDAGVPRCAAQVRSLIKERPRARASSLLVCPGRLTDPPCPCLFALIVCAMGKVLVVTHVRTSTSLSLSPFPLPLHQLTETLLTQYTRTHKHTNASVSARNAGHNPHHQTATTKKNGVQGGEAIHVCCSTATAAVVEVSAGFRAHPPSRLLPSLDAHTPQRRRKNKDTSSRYSSTGYTGARTSGNRTSFLFSILLSCVLPLAVYLAHLHSTLACRITTSKHSRGCAKLRAVAL